MIAWHVLSKSGLFMSVAHTHNFEVSTIFVFSQNSWLLQFPPIHCLFSGLNSPLFQGFWRWTRDSGSVGSALSVPLPPTLVPVGVASSAASSVCLFFAVAGIEAPGNLEDLKSHGFASRGSTSIILGPLTGSFAGSGKAAKC